MTGTGSRGFRAAAAVAALTGLALLVGATPAVAHVAVDEATGNGDGTATVTLAWDHSCTADTVTTGVTVTAGDGIEFLGGASELQGWTASVAPDRIAFAGPGVPTGQRSAVTVTARISGSPGRAVQFPATQHCLGPGGDSSVDWVDPDPESQHPAPTMIATAAVLSPAPVADSGGATLTQALVGVLLLAAALGCVGALAHRLRPPT